MAMLFKVGQWVINLNNVIAIDTEYTQTTTHRNRQNEITQKTTKQGLILYLSVPSVIVNNPAPSDTENKPTIVSGEAKQTRGFNAETVEVTSPPPCPKRLIFFDQEAEAIRTWLAKHIPDVMLESS